MKLLLIQPPIEDYYDTSIRTYPLGLLYIAARVSPIAETVVFDARTGVKSIPVGTSEFDELTPFYGPGRITPFSFFDRYKRFGLTFDQIKARIACENPDVVAVSAMCSAYERQALEVAEAAKQVSGEIVTVMGGIHPTLFPEHVLSNDCVDYCIRGEGETPFFELVSALSRHAVHALPAIEGLCFREGGGLRMSGVNVEKQPDLVPERRLLDAGSYRIGRKPYAFFLTSRGCPFSCGFCGKPEVPYRRLSIGAIEKDLEACEKLGVEAIDFEDDMLNLDGDSFARTLAALKGRGFTLSAMNGIYPGNMDVPTLRLMFEAGFRRLNFSLVDVSEPVLRTQKRARHESFLRLLPFLDESPFLVEVHFIIGLPGQDPASLLDTMLFLMGKRLLLGPSLFYLAPGSPFHRDGASGVGTVPFRSMRSSAMLPFNPLFPREVSFTFVKLVRFVNYVKQLLDDDPAIARMSDLPGIPPVVKDARKRTIVETLVREGRFIYYDARACGFRDEPVDASLVRLFFERARGSTLKGYRTKNSLVVD